VNRVPGHGQPSFEFVLRPVPPFRLDLTVWALRRRPRNLLDRWDGTTYRRVIVIGGRPTELTARQVVSSTAPRLIVMATPAPRTSLERRRVRSVVDRLLGLRIDLTDWYEMSAGDARLRLLADRFRGMKPPKFPTKFEAVVNAFACQQLSLEVGLELLNRLATISGVRFGTGSNMNRADNWIVFVFERLQPRDDLLAEIPCDYAVEGDDQYFMAINAQPVGMQYPFDAANESECFATARPGDTANRVRIRVDKWRYLGTANVLIPRLGHGR
jgi:hypothetical protein